MTSVAILLILAVSLCNARTQFAEESMKKRSVPSGSVDDGVEQKLMKRSIPAGMIDDQITEAFIKNAVEEREAERWREARRRNPYEIPLALPLEERVRQPLYHDEQRGVPAAERLREVSPDFFSQENEDEPYLPYYMDTEDRYLSRRRRSSPARRVVHKRGGVEKMTRALNMKRSAAVRRKKRQVTLSDEDLEALISFLRDIKQEMERLPASCNIAAHHSTFGDNELDEEIGGAGSGMDDDDYIDEDDLRSSLEQDQDYPTWMISHSRALQPIPRPQRRSFRYPYLLPPGQKRAARQHYAAAGNQQGPQMRDEPSRRY